MFQKLKFKSLQRKAKKLHDLREQGANIDVKNEIAAQIELGKFYDNHPFNKNYPHADLYALECYRMAASLGDPEAQYICGKRLFDKARFWENWSTGMYGSGIHKKYASSYYEEAFTYLKEAESHSHPLAKRLQGLAYINGWGVAKNVEVGFKMVVESIEQEGTWDKATQIFQELGLNNPEFFSMLLTYKPKAHS